MTCELWYTHGQPPELTSFLPPSLFPPLHCPLLCASSFLFPLPSHDGAKGTPSGNPPGAQAVDPILKRLTHFIRRERDRAAGAGGAGNGHGAEGEGDEEGERDGGGGGTGHGGALALPATSLLAASLSMALTCTERTLSRTRLHTPKHYSRVRP